MQIGVRQVVGQRSLFAVAAARPLHLYHEIAFVIGDIDVPAAVYRNTYGLVQAAAHRGAVGGRNAGWIGRGCLQHPTVVGIGNIDVAAAVHRHAVGKDQATAHRALRARPEGNLRPYACARQIRRRQHIAARICQDHRAQPRPGVLRREDHVHGAGLSGQIR